MTQQTVFTIEDDAAIRRAGGQPFELAPIAWGKMRAEEMAELQAKRGPLPPVENGITIGEVLEELSLEEKWEREA